METIKQILIDSLNGLSADMIPLFLFQLLVSALLGLLLEKIINRKFGEDTSERGVILAPLAALLASLVKYSLSFSVMGSALILLFLRQREMRRDQTLSLIAVLAIGVGCGTGSVIQTGIGFVFISVLIWFMPAKK